jgi:hypothetical protein
MALTARRGYASRSSSPQSHGCPGVTPDGRGTGGRCPGIRHRFNAIGFPGGRISQLEPRRRACADGVELFRRGGLPDRIGAGGKRVCAAGLRPPRAWTGVRNVARTRRRAVATVTDSAGGNPRAATGLAVDGGGLRAVHVPAVSVCRVQLHFCDVASRRHSLAQNVLSDGKVARGECEVVVPRRGSNNLDERTRTGLNSSLTGVNGLNLNPGCQFVAAVS